MNYELIVKKYSDIFQIKEYAEIAPLTTLNIGGKARILILVQNIFNKDQLNNIHKVNDIEELIKNTDIKLSELILDLEKNNIKYFILGAGSDVLFSDNLFEGVIVKITSRDTILLEDIPSREETYDNNGMTRYSKAESEQKSLNFDAISFEETKKNPKYVYADSGVMMPYLINYTLGQGLTGLQWFGYIPSSVGGSVYNNIHGGKMMLSEYIEYVVLLNKNNMVELVKNKDMDFHYDHSRVQISGELVLGVVFKLFKADENEILKAKNFYKEWIEQKANIQPQQRSAGSTFKNLTNEQKEKLNLPTNAAGYLIQEAGLKGYSIGDAQIYENHGNFFINKGNAKAQDYKALIEFAIEKIKDKYGITLEPEIKFVNF